MSTINSIHTPSQIPLIESYTGTENQPDLISFFSKSGPDLNSVKIIDDQFINEIDYSPKNFSTAIPRIQKAIQIIFQEIKNQTYFKKNSELGNACKNLGRGMVQLVPILGIVALYTYDKLKKSLYIHPKIEQALASQHEVIGIAFDGNPTFTIPMSTLEPFCRNSKKSLVSAYYCWLSLKHNALRNQTQITTLELAEKWQKFLSSP